MLSRNLENSLHRALALASDRKHEYATLEHLLMALTEDQDAIAVLRACGVDIDKLGGELQHYLEHELGKTRRRIRSRRRASSASSSAPRSTSNRRAARR